MPTATTARLLFMLVSACTAWFGVTYLLHAFAGGWAAAYHQRLAGGLPFDTLAPAVTSLYRTLVGTLGSLFVATGVTTFLLARAATAPGGSPAAWRGLLALNGVGLLLLVVANLRNGIHSPWWTNLIVLALLGVALSLARPARAA